MIKHRVIAESFFFSFLLSTSTECTLIPLSVSPEEVPYLFPVAGLQTNYAQQAVAFLPKNVCDVRKVEIARGIRLCKSSAEPISFRVPRVRVSACTLGACLRGLYCLLLLDTSGYSWILTDTSDTSGYFWIFLKIHL